MLGDPRSHNTNSISSATFTLHSIADPPPISSFKLESLKSPSLHIKYQKFISIKFVCNFHVYIGRSQINLLPEV